MVVGALVLTGVVDPGQPVDERALTWHVGVWDLWFLLWGLALLVAVWRVRTNQPDPRPGGDRKTAMRTGGGTGAASGENG